MKEKDRAFWVVLIVSLALVGFLLSYAEILRRHPPAALIGQGGIATDIYVEKDGPPTVFTIPDGGVASIPDGTRFSGTGAVVLHDNFEIMLKFPDRRYAMMYLNEKAGNYYSFEGVKGIIVQVAHPGTDGQGCLVSLRPCRPGFAVGCMDTGTWCDSPRYVDVFTEDGKRVRVDRASGEISR